MKKRFKTLLSLFLASVFLISAALPSLALAPPISVSPTYASGKYYDQLLQVQLTGDMRKDIVAVAKSQVGYLEGDYSWQVDGTVAGDGNYTEYNNYLYGGKKGGWCGMFVSWCAAMAGIPTSILNRATSAKPYYYEGYGFNFISDKKGVDPLEGSDFKGYYDLPCKGGDYIPQPGDLIFFASYNAKNVSSLPRSCYKHVGLVEYTDVVYNEDGSLAYIDIHTIEGNTSDKVREKSYKQTPNNSGYVYEDTFIAAFGIPAYRTSEKSDSCYYDIGAYEKSTLKPGSSGESVIKLQLALRILAEIYPTIKAPQVTGYYDSDTRDAVLAYQSLKKLSVDGKCGPQSWASIRSVLIFETAKISDDFLMDDDGTLLFYKGRSESLTLPQDCTAIAPYAFYDSNALSTLKINKALCFIDENAFSSTSALQTVVFLGNRSDFSGLTVEEVGNDAFANAEQVYQEENYYTITFDVNGTKTTVKCLKGDLPVFSGTTDRPDDTLRYFFAGWDRPIAPATEDTTYTATYHTISAEPVLLTGSCRGESFSMGHMTFDIYLKNTPGVSSFCFNADYSMYLSDLTFVSFSSAIEGVSCDASLDGILQFTYDGENTDAGDLLVGTVTFKVNKNLYFGEDCASCPIQLFFLISDGYLCCRLPEGEVVELSVSCDLVEIWVYSHLIYDYTDDGSLNILDASALLDRLNCPPEGTEDSNNLKVTDLTIADVTNILDLLATP